MAVDGDRQCRPRAQHDVHRPRERQIPAGTRARNHRLGRPQGDRERQSLQASGGQCDHHPYARGSTRSSRQHAKAARRQLVELASRTTGEAAINLDLPISRRNRDFSALGNLTLNGNAEVDQLSDFGTLTIFGAGANWSPVDRLNFITSWTREEGPPTINQLGDPVLDTPGLAHFRFHDRADRARGRDHWRQPGSARRPPQRLEAGRQLAALFENRPSAARGLCSPDDRPAGRQYFGHFGFEAAFPDRFVCRADLRRRISTIGQRRFEAGQFRQRPQATRCGSGSTSRSR